MPGWRDIYHLLEFFVTTCYRVSGVVTGRIAGQTLACTWTGIRCHRAQIPQRLAASAVASAQESPCKGVFAFIGNDAQTRVPLTLRFLKKACTTLECGAWPHNALHTSINVTIHIIQDTLICASRHIQMGIVHSICTRSMHS